jgi:hypothetical protein
MKRDNQAPPADEWEPVEPTRAAVADVTVQLRKLSKHGPIRLGAALAMSVCQRLGWKHGTALGLSIGAGRRDGWVRVAVAPMGRPLRPLGRAKSFLFVALDAGRLAGYEADAAPAEWRIDGDALLVELPWRLPPAAAGEEAGA